MKFVSLAKRYLDTSRREIEGEITHFCLPNPNSYGFYSSTVCFTYPRSSRRLRIFLPGGSARHKEKEDCFYSLPFLAPPTGLEPVTP